MPLTYVRNIKMRDLEELADLPEERQAIEIVARCYGVSVDVVLEMEPAEFSQCSTEVAIRNGLNTDE
jgi:hypothetical protein